MMYVFILLSSLHCVTTGQTFDVSSQGISNMSEYPMPSNIKYAIFLNNSIQQVPTSYFTNYADLFQITLSKNPVSNIANFTFSAVPSVKLLIIRYHLLTKIEKYAFSGLVHLKKLTLLNGLIHTIHPDSFQDTTEMTHLWLSWNKLSVIHKELFAPLHKLQILQIHDNELHLIEEGSFKYNTLLGNLMLQNNLLESFPSYLFNMEHHTCTIGLDLYWNPINCNKSMCYLLFAEKDWINFKHPHLLTCSGGNFHSRTWNTLEIEDLCTGRFPSLCVSVCVSVCTF